MLSNKEINIVNRTDTFKPEGLLANKANSRNASLESKRIATANCCRRTYRIENLRYALRYVGKLLVDANRGRAWLRRLLVANGIKSLISTMV